MEVSSWSFEDPGAVMYSYVPEFLHLEQLRSYFSPLSGTKIVVSKKFENSFTGALIERHTF